MRRAVLPFYALIFLTELVWMAIVPLTPTYAERLSLGEVEVGAVLAAAGVATLAVSVPIGVVADRIGKRRITVGSAALIALSTLGQAVAPEFWTLLAARAAFGLALGAVWTVGLAWTSESSSRGRQAAAVGTTVTVAGAGIVIGPAFAGVVAHALGLRAPFLFASVAAAVVAAALARSGIEDSAKTRQPVAETLQTARRDRVILGSALVITLVGVLGGGVNLLVPLQLERNGLSSAATGLVFSASSAIFVLASAFVARAGGRFVTLRAVGAAAVLYALSMLFVIGASSTAAIVAFLLVRSPFWGTLSTLAYPLGALGAQRAELGQGAVLGLLNLVWGAAAAASPVVLAALAQAAGDRWAFAALAACAAAAGAWLLAARHATDCDYDEPAYVAAP